MGNLTNFNNNGIEAAESNFDPLPEGNYNVWITDSEIKPTRKGDGSILKLTLQVIEGKYENRLLFVNLNLVNPNQQAVAIAKAELKAICFACGIPIPEDSSELHDKPFTVAVKVQKRKGSDDEMENRIKKYIPRTVEPVAAGESKPWQS